MPTRPFPALNDHAHAKGKFQRFALFVGVGKRLLTFGLGRFRFGSGLGCDLGRTFQKFGRVNLCHTSHLGRTQVIGQAKGIGQAQGIQNPILLGQNLSTVQIKITLIVNLDQLTCTDCIASTFLDGFHLERDSKGITNGQNKNSCKNLQFRHIISYSTK